ncbi:MAG: PAS domain-containing protein [Planctomycetota bacterium]|nr:PAS domain-containing protein [Planctomycetota bacterium]
MALPARPVHKLFSSGSVALVGWRAEDGWPLDFVSPSLRDILGFGADDLLSQGTGLEKLVHPSDLDDLREAHRVHVASSAERFDPADFRLKTAEGQWRWVHASLTIERDAEGGAARLFGYLLDVTDRKRAETALERQRQRLELVIQGTRLGMWDWNPQTNDVMFNETWAQMLGYELSEITPSLEEWESRVHPDDLAACYEDITAHMEGRVPFYENVHRMRHKRGHWVYILDRGQIMERDEQGRPTRFTGTHTDITKEKLAELEAKEANDAKSLFLANMSHEIRTPLNGVLGLVQLLESTDLDAEQLDHLRLIRESGEGLLTVINDILDFSKIEAGELTVDPHSFDLERVVRRVADLHREVAFRKGLQLHVEARGDIPDWIISDSHRVQQVLMNLVSNAVKFTEVGSVSIHVDAQPATAGIHDLKIQVRDTGKGIEDASAIFDSFRQEDAGISRQYGGTGLGLAISRRLADLLGGGLDVESTPGEGSTFTLWLPVEVGEPVPDRVPGSAFETTDLESLRILVAEDNEVNQVVAQSVLEKLGAQVDIAKNGAEAVAAVEEATYDLVLMDMHMPEMDGLEAARRLRAHPSTIRLPIIALSADALPETREACLEAGMNAFMTKPFEVELLSESIQQVLAARAADAADLAAVRRRSAS